MTQSREELLRLTDALSVVIRAIAREEAQHAANHPLEQWELIDPDAAMDTFEQTALRAIARDSATLSGDRR